MKFTCENPLKILASSEESAKLFAESYTYYPGFTRALNTGHSDSSDDEDDMYPTEVIDLRALLFKDSEAPQSNNHQHPHNPSDELVSIIPGATPPGANLHHLQALRKAQGPPPKLTTDMMEVENTQIKGKINKFLDGLNVPGRQRYNSSEEETKELNQTQHTSPGGVKFNVTMSQKQNSQEPPKHTSNELSKSSENHPTNSKSTSTADLFPQTNQSNEKNNVPREDAASDNNDGQATDFEKAHGKPKYGYQHIRGRPADGQLRGTYKSEDLVLQALTGVPISNVLGTHVPLHAASRAMRHTATFKMHKIVERLIHERTRYERHQVEEVKRKMATDDTPAAAAEPSGPGGRRLSDLSITSII